jgi:hypothetical protein
VAADMMMVAPLRIIEVSGRSSSGNTVNESPPRPEAKARYQEEANTHLHNQLLAAIRDMT